LCAEEAERRRADAGVVARAGAGLDLGKGLLERQGGTVRTVAHHASTTSATARMRVSGGIAGAVEALVVLAAQTYQRSARSRPGS
jgi:hypothetical protein